LRLLPVFAASQIAAQGDSGWQKGLKAPAKN
jgi:hypothetical protein